jgi:hypothetical protein
MLFNGTRVAVDVSSVQFVPASLVAITSMEPAAKQVLTVGQLIPLMAARGPDDRAVHALPTPGLVMIMPAFPTATHGFPAWQATAVSPVSSTG